jgi:hypothetical protein
MSDSPDARETGSGAAPSPEEIERRRREIDDFLAGLPRLPPMTQAEMDAILYDLETGLPWPGGNFALTDITPALPPKPKPRG